MDAACGPKTACILIAYIYGRRTDVSHLLDVAERRKLPYLEDCAESFSGLDYVGDDRATVSFFSFGGIKVATAFGGGVAVVRDPEIGGMMRSMHSFYPQQKRSNYAWKLLKYSAVALPMNVQSLNRNARRLSGALDIDHKKYVVAFTRGFPDRFFERLRERPSTPLLLMLERRLATFARLGNFEGGVMAGRRAVERLQDVQGLLVPGQAASVQNFWLFPVIVDDVPKFLRRINKMGVDSYSGATQLDVVRPTAAWVRAKKLAGEAPPRPTPVADWMMAHTLYLPVHRRVSRRDVDLMCDRVSQCCEDMGCPPLVQPLVAPVATGGGGSASSVQPASRL